MNPYYEDGTCTIYHGDCREVLPSLSFDVIVTDPPYGIGWKIGKGLGISDNHGAPIVGDDSTALRDWLLSTYPMVPSLVFGSLRASLPAHWVDCLIFHKDCHNAGLVGSRLPWRRTWEPIFVCGEWPDQTPTRGSVIATREMAQSGYSGYTTRARHPHAKPEDVMRTLLEVCPSGIIVDPFAGSGTTLRAAKDLGRKAIGIEIEERYCEIAAKRLGQEVFNLAQ